MIEFQAPQLNLKFRPFEILELYNGIVWVSQMELSGVLTTIMVSIGLAHTTPLYLARISNGLFLVL